MSNTIKRIQTCDSFPFLVTVDKAVYIDGTSKTLDVKLKELERSRGSGKWIEGKKILCIGDSLTAGQGSNKPWCNIIAERNEMTLYRKGISGDSIARIADRCKALTEQADIAIFWGGTNDSNTSNYGTMDDRESTSFYGSLHLGLSELQKKYEKVFVMNIWNFKKSNENVKKLNGIIKEVADYYSMPVIDVFSNLGLHGDSPQVPRMREYHDGLHFNDKGSVVLADVVERFLISH